MTKTTINPQEVEKFVKMADEWWNESGKFKPLHRLNPTRVEYIRNSAIDHFKLKNKNTPLKGLTLLDIGCGGGLLSEPMSRLGAKVTGIDAAEKNIHIASLHRDQMQLDITYQATTAENLAKKKTRYDIVLAMEVVEHVNDVPLFLKSAANLVKPGGLLFVATLNRTAKSYALAIIGAEYILGWLPRGTHDWKKFLKPSEITHMLPLHEMQLDALEGVSYNPLTTKWSLGRDTGVNYMMRFSRSKNTIATQL